MPFLRDAACARALVQRFGDPFQGRPPARQHFREQSFAPMAVPSWALGLLPPVLFTAAASVVLVRALTKDGLSPLEILWAGLFSSLCFLACAGLTAALIGFAAGLFRRSGPRALGHEPRTSGAASLPSSLPSSLPRSALLLPIYHESAEHVFAAVAAMRESLARTPGGDAFEIFVLSDSREPGRQPRKSAPIGASRARRCAGPMPDVFPCTIAGARATSARKPVTWPSSSSASGTATRTR